MTVTDAMVERAAKAAYGDHFERYRKMMRKALEAAIAVVPEPGSCACGGVPANPYPGWEAEQAR